MSKVEPIERRKRELERAALAAACSGKLSERDGSGVELSFFLLRCCVVVAFSIPNNIGFSVDAAKCPNQVKILYSASGQRSNRS